MRGDGPPGCALAAAVGASHRLPCAARPGVVRRNSLRSLRSLRSDTAPQVRCTKRASRADPGTALLGAADSAQPGGPSPRIGAPWRRAGPTPSLSPPFARLPPPAAMATPLVFDPKAAGLFTDADQRPHVASTHDNTACMSCGFACVRRDADCARHDAACKGAGRGSGAPRVPGAACAGRPDGGAVCGAEQRSVGVGARSALRTSDLRRPV